MRWLKRLVLGLAFLVALFLAAAWLTSRPGDPSVYPPPASAVSTYNVYVVSHGYHAGLVIRRSDLADIASRTGNVALISVANRFGGFGWIEFGWGDESFYREAPYISSVTIGLALRALFSPGNRSVLHVVGLTAEPQLVFRSSTIVRMQLGRVSFERLLHALDRTFAREPDGKLPGDLGRGLYGPSLFYRAVGEFSFLKVCNHWVADMLDQAGVPTTPVIDTLPQGLLFDLKWRAGAVTVR
jgi:uncharacterized protein (TIGR02117 family)